MDSMSDRRARCRVRLKRIDFLELNGTCRVEFALWAYCLVMTVFVRRSESFFEERCLRVFLKAF